MYVIALTGGIGSGKSEAAKQFARLGVPIVDTDAIAHSLTAVGEPTLAKIAHDFGTGFLNTDDSLNRAKLRTHIFNNPAERQKLEAILHPAIRERAIRQLADNENQLHPDYQILVVPLLFESNSYKPIVQKTLAIDCDESTQIKRTMARSQLTESDVKAMMQTQVSRATRLERADEIIENSGSVEELAEKVNKIHKKFIKTCIVSK